MELRVKYHVPDEKLEKFRIRHIHQSDWIDLRVAEDVHLSAGQVYSLPLGVSIELPPDCEAHIAARSSTLHNYGLIGVFGVIDNSYCGDNDIWHFQVYATRDVDLTFGQRVAQFRVFPKMVLCRFTEVKELGNDDRGGLGSTGRD